jgi:hypothetical protein
MLLEFTAEVLRLTDTINEHMLCVVATNTLRRWRWQAGCRRVCEALADRLEEATKAGFLLSSGAACVILGTVEGRHQEKGRRLMSIAAEHLLGGARRGDCPTLDQIRRIPYILQYLTAEGAKVLLPALHEQYRLMADRGCWLDISSIGSTLHGLGPFIETETNASYGLVAELTRHVHALRIAGRRLDSRSFGAIGACLLRSEPNEVMEGLVIEAADQLNEYSALDQHVELFYLLRLCGELRSYAGSNAVPRLLAAVRRHWPGAGVDSDDGITFDEVAGPPHGEGSDSVREDPSVLMAELIIGLRHYFASVSNATDLVSRLYSFFGDSIDGPVPTKGQLSDEDARLGLLFRLLSVHVSRHEAGAYMRIMLSDCSLHAAEILITYGLQQYLEDPQNDGKTPLRIVFGVMGNRPHDPVKMKAMVERACAAAGNDLTAVAWEVKYVNIFGKAKR